MIGLAPEDPDGTPAQDAPCRPPWVAPYVIAWLSVLPGGGPSPTWRGRVGRARRSSAPAPGNDPGTRFFSCGDPGPGIRRAASGAPTVIPVIGSTIGARASAHPQRSEDLCVVA